MALFARIKHPEPVRAWFQKMLRLRINDQQKESRSTADNVQGELTVLRDQQDRLLNLRLLDEIEAGTFARKNTELREPHCRADAATGICTSRPRQTRGLGAASV